MSAPQDKKKRDFDGFDLGKRNNAKSKNKDSAQKTARITIITLVAVAVLFFASLFINSDYFRQNFTAVTIDNTKYSVTDVDYYIENIYMQYYSTMSSAGDVGTSMLPDKSTSLKSQIYDRTTGETWSEFFREMALEQMKSDNKIYVEAQKAGFKLSDTDKTNMEADISSMKSNSTTNGYTTFNAYLKAAYGKSMNEAAFRKNVERSYIITSYTTYMHDSFKYTPADIESYYTQNKDSLDIFTYRYFMVNAADVKQTDYPDDTAYQAAKDAALAASGDKAAAYAAAITDEQSFITAARDYDAETYKDDSSTQKVYKGELLGSTYGTWMKDASRKFGDVSTFKSTTGYYVVFYGTRDDNHYLTANVQQILVKPETVDQTKYASDSDTTQYDAAVELAKETASVLANKIYKEWQDGGATQDKLKELTTTYTAQISTADSVYNENVYKGQLPTEVNTWLYDASRKAGDHAVIYSEANGYYIVDYVGTGKQYSDVLSDTKKRDTDLQAWKDALKGGEPKKTWLMTLAQ
jgi:hypothetical protein